MPDYYEDDEVFRDINGFYKRLMARMFREIQGFEKAIQNNQLRGNWDFKPIKGPGVWGYTARGRFQLEGEPTHISRNAIEQKREPLTDVFDEKENVKIYMELPGASKDEIQLNVTEQFVEVKAKNFAKKVELPHGNLNLEEATSNYKNGVLQVVIPKVQETVKDVKKRTIKIE